MNNYKTFVTGAFYITSFRCILTGFSEQPYNELLLIELIILAIGNAIIVAIENKGGDK